VTKNEARKLTAKVRRDAEALWLKLLDLYEGGAHTALGYSSWAAYFEAEFGQGKANAYRLLNAAKVHRIVSLHVETRGLSEAQARVLDGLPDERLAEVAREVKDRGGWSRVSAQEVKRIAFGRLADAGASPKPLALSALNRAAREISELRKRPDQVRDVIRAADPVTRARSLRAIREFREELDFIEDVITGAGSGDAEESAA
jgi:hypothetical protein